MTGVAAAQETQVADFAASNSLQITVDVLAKLTSAVCELHDVAQLTTISTTLRVKPFDIPAKACPFKGFEDEVLLGLEAFERESTLRG